MAFFDAVSFVLGSSSKSSTEKIEFFTVCFRYFFRKLGKINALTEDYNMKIQVEFSNMEHGTVTLFILSTEKYSYMTLMFDNIWMH